MNAKVDAEPILPASELAILLTGRRTYVRTPGRHLVHRTAGRITLGWPRGVLHAEHVCNGR